MSEAQMILRLIEAVDPADAAKLDEIDARVWCLANGVSFRQFIPDDHSGFGFCGVIDQDGGKYDPPETIYYSEHGESYLRFPRFTRSRDALKSVRPAGWTAIVPHLCLWQFVKGERPDLGYLAYDAATEPVECATEELAELHAIVQAIDHGRSAA